MATVQDKKSKRTKSNTAKLAHIDDRFFVDKKIRAYNWFQSGKPLLCIDQNELLEDVFTYYYMQTGPDPERSILRIRNKVWWNFLSRYFPEHYKKFKIVSFYDKYINNPTYKYPVARIKTWVFYADLDHQLLCKLAKK